MQAKRTRQSWESPFQGARHCDTLISTVSPSTIWATVPESIGEDAVEAIEENITVIPKVIAEIRTAIVRAFLLLCLFFHTINILQLTIINYPNLIISRPSILGISPFNSGSRVALMRSALGGHPGINISTGTTS